VHSPAEGRHFLAAGMSEGRGGGGGITTTPGAPAGSSSSSSDSTICTSFVSRSARTNAKEEEEEKEEGSFVGSVMASSSCTVLSGLEGPTAGCSEMEATPKSPLAIETIICSPRLVSGGRSELATVGTSQVGSGHWTRADWGTVPQSLSSAEGFGTSLHKFLRGGGAGGRVVSTVQPSLAGELWDNIQLSSVSGANVSKGFLEIIFPLTAGEASVG